MCPEVCAVPFCYILYTQFYSSNMLTLLKVKFYASRHINIAYHKVLFELAGYHSCVIIGMLTLIITSFCQ
jgi:hypothetical protein